MLELQPSPVLLPAEKCRQVEFHLAELLDGEAFANSRRSRQFLRYIVEETLAGRGAAIKERNIAVDVFGKGSDFDSQAESIVRVKAAEVRKRLAQAYNSMPPGDLRLELPLGTYQPVLHFKQTSTPPSPQPALPLTAHASSAWGRKTLWASGLGALALLLAFAFSYCRQSAPLDLLWQPFLQGNRAVLMSLPAPTTYEVKRADRPLLLHPESMLPVSALVPRENYYVGVGAAEGAARFGAQLGARHIPFLVKFGNDVSFSDLRQSPAILLGGTTSRWTIEFTRSLPLRFDEMFRPRIVDSQHSGKFWQERFDLRPGPYTGYALVTRLLNSESGNVVLMVAGIDAYDTQSAVEFLTRSDFFDAFARRRPDWASKNFQIVLQNSIHERTPGPPELVTYRVW